MRQLLLSPLHMRDSFIPVPYQVTRTVGRSKPRQWTPNSSFPFESRSTAIPFLRRIERAPLPVARVLLQQEGAIEHGMSSVGGEEGGKGLGNDGVQGAALQSRCEALLGERKAMQVRP